MEVTVLRTVGIPVPDALSMLTSSSQGTLGAAKGKRAGIGLVEPCIPGLGANLNGNQPLIGTNRGDQAIINHPGNGIACHRTSIRNSSAGGAGGHRRRLGDGVPWPERDGREPGGLSVLASFPFASLAAADGTRKNYPCLLPTTCKNNPIITPLVYCPLPPCQLHYV